jgi:probable F420-dependent oxidoreductase
MFANGDRSAGPDHAAALTVAAEETGFESLWAVQHVAMPVDHQSKYPYSSAGTVPGGVAVAIPDPLVWLAFVAAMTTKIRLATGVLVLPQQHALVVAKQAASLDRLSRGRLMLGVGAGWLREEFDALGAEFDGRGALMDEQIEVMRRAWSMGTFAHKGEWMRFDDVAVEPKPEQTTIPVIIGGHSGAAVRRAARLGDGFFPLGKRGQDLRAIVGRLAECAVTEGRDPVSIEVTADAPRTADQVQTILDVGVSRVLINAPAVPTGDLSEALADARQEVVDLLSAG